MKLFICSFTLLSSILFSYSHSQEMGALTDERDGQSYKTVTIDGKTWLAENLKFKAEGSVSYKKDEKNDAKYGRYYTYEAALKSCPTGWELPTEEQYQALSDKFGGNYDSGKKLKSTSDWYWTTNGDNSSGFNIVPAGKIYKNNDSGQGETATFWVAGEAPEGKGLIRTISSRDGNTYKAYKFKNESFTKANGKMTIRCIKK